jgi:hypothetical protein
MGDRAKEITDGGAHALGWAIRGDQIGVISLECDQLSEQGVELGVGDHRVVEDVVAMVVLSDLGTQLFETRCSARG